MSKQNRRTHALARFSRRSATRVPQWDTPDFTGWPEVDLDAARTRVTQLVEAHVAAGSTDEAHGDIVDRIVHPVANVWRGDVYMGYVDRRHALEEGELQGQEHLSRLLMKVHRSERRRATAAAMRDAALLDLVGGEDLTPADDLEPRTTEPLAQGSAVSHLTARLAPPITVYTSRRLRPDDSEALLPGTAH